MKAAEVIPPATPVRASAATPRSRPLLKVVLVLAMAVLAGVVAWPSFFSGQVSTDDAQVDSHITTVSPRLSGYVDRVPVNDNQAVTVGELLTRIDPRDYQAAVDQAAAAYEVAVAQARSAHVATDLAATASLKAAEAAVEAKRAVNVRAQSDLARYEPLLRSRDLSQLQFDGVNAAARVAASDLALVEQQLAEAQKVIGERDAQYQSAVAAIARARAQLELARLQLGYTEIRAPIAGVVTQKAVQLGEQVSPGRLLLTIVPLDDVYVTANFKETQLADVRPGQRASIEADMYPGLSFEGTVDSISGAAGSRQALLPPQNATGNFVKVVQRVPVKILLKRSAAPGAVLRPGTNVRATVHVR
jgi:membrane fusion protein (multidrug efflux system)